MFQLLVIVLLGFLNPTVEKPGLTETEKWKLGWRMIVSSMNENYAAGELQFDSLLSTSSRLDKKFVLTGLQILNKNNKTEKIGTVLGQLDHETLEFICGKTPFDQSKVSFDVCSPFKKSVQAENPELQVELVKMFINDQSVRGANMDVLIAKYKLIKKDVVNGKDGVSTDLDNRNRLKEIFALQGFPTKKMVGTDAMQGIFMMIQHSDGDKEWQASQLPNIKQSVLKGDMDGQSYAYLYDRIKINNGEMQLYGTQFAVVDPKKKIATLAPTEDEETLDLRRMEVGMMPIAAYKAFMLKFN